MSLTDLYYYVDLTVPTVALHGAVSGARAGSVRITRPGEVVPPIVAKLARLRNYANPVATLDHAYNKTWQRVFNGAGSGSVTMRNDDPDLALIRDGDLIRFEHYGVAAFTFVVADREKVTIASGEEHDEATTLSGPGLLAWLTQSMLVYPSRSPEETYTLPGTERAIQGEPIEEDRVFSWASYRNLVDGAYGIGIEMGPLPDSAVTDDGWPAEMAAVPLIWADRFDSGACYFRQLLTTDATEIEGYVYSQDAMMIWFDGTLVVESDGGPDAGTVQTFSASVTSYGTNSHVVAMAVFHDEARPPGVAMAIYTTDEEGNIAGALASSDTTWPMIAYPPEAPRVTAGGVVQAVLAELNARRVSPQIGGDDWSPEVDSDGNPWPYLAEVSTKVGTTVWELLQEMEPYIDFFMGSDPNQLQIWVKGMRGSERNVNLHGATDEQDPWSGNLKGLTHRRQT